MNATHGAKHGFLILRKGVDIVRPNHDHDIIPGGPVVLLQSKRFTQQAFDAIAHDRGPDATIDAEAEAEMTEIVRTTMHDERADDFSASSGENA
jgi:hypothetical protein